MRIKNMTKTDLLCFVENESLILKQGQSMEIGSFETIRFSHNRTSYSRPEADNSKILKALSFFDDPFKLRREYNIVVDFEINIDQLRDPKQLTITSATKYADVATRTHYEYFIVRCDGESIAPSNISVAGSEKIKADFKANDKKFMLWDAVWNILIEPIIFEIIGYLMMYQLFSVWFEAYAGIVIAILIMLNILIELVFLFAKLKNNRSGIFNNYLSESIIRENCYSIKN